MNEQELRYLQQVKSVIAKGTDAVQTIDELTELQKPSTAELSVTTQTLIEFIDNLEFEREDGELDGGVDDYDTAEARIATKNLQKIENTLADIDSGNLYRQVFWAELVYSNLQNGEYLYKTMGRKLGAESSEQAVKEKDDIKAKASKQHPDDPSFKLEDVRVNVEIIDSNGKTVEPQSFLSN